ncbi:PTS sugar transporter subunit IIA [Roseomonas xinghualingensis]|uniref:PTS sugar transporter subunit IIA n=1 Tax=Roseomonas xinghualingensis TaxID=2986475 RepID=UPI0021F1D779|nr:PTS sugar transporter subunit IIA [Roseomonas sp. SXEYE001]MCV4206272.1 PTS sugar transporter subunit IIA [Roseomonas sp. SXEYE001]
MGTTNLFPADGVLDLNAPNKSGLLQILAAEAATRLGCPEEEVLSALQAREALGSTALGRGIALPHARMEGIQAPVALLARLRKPIEFEAKDGEPVDLVFLVIWPTEATEGFLPALSDICRVLREPQVPRQLRQAKSPQEALDMLRETGLVGPARTAGE